MARSSSAAHDEVQDDEFDPAAQLAILRRAVAGVVLAGNGSPVELAPPRAELRRLCALAEIVLLLLSQGELAGEARRLAVRLKSRLPQRSVLELVRQRLHACLVSASEELPVAYGVGTRLDGALAMRTLLSDFHASLLPAEDLPWALTVANAELSLLMLQPALERGPAFERAALARLRGRVRRWSEGAGQADQEALYEEVQGSARLLELLSQRPEVRRHDERALRLLSITLASGVHDLELAGRAAETLSALRGLDLELDRSMVQLPLEPAAALARIWRRVRELRAAALPS